MIRGLAALVDEAGRADDVDQLIADAFAREETSSTGLPGGIAIPHCRTTGVAEPTLGLRPARPAGRLRRQGRPGRPRLPDRGPRRRRRHPPPAPHQAGPLAGQAGLHRLAARGRDARGGRRADRPAPSASRAAAGAGPAAAPAPPPPPPAPPRPPLPRPPPGCAAASARSPSPPARPASPTPTWPPRPSRPRPSGPASTISVETQGSAGSTPLSPDTIANAAAVIFAVDVGVRDRGRFAGKPMVVLGREAPDRRRRRDDRRGAALRRRPERAPGRGHRRATAGAHVDGGDESWGARTRRVLMTGVSYMIPFVAAGGLLIALGFLLGGYEIVGPRGDIAGRTTRSSTCPTVDDARPRRTPCSTRACWPTSARCSSSSARRPSRFFVPALAGYIAYAIADRPGIAPGFVMGGLVTDVAGLRPPADRLPRRASSAASSPASSPTGSPAGRCRPGPAA